MAYLIEAAQVEDVRVFNKERLKLDELAEMKFEDLWEFLKKFITIYEKNYCILVVFFITFLSFVIYVISLVLSYTSSFKIF